MKKYLIAVFAAFLFIFTLTFGVQPTYANCHGTGIVLGEGANIRERPSTNSQIIGWYRGGAFATGWLVTGDYVVDPNGGRYNQWLQLDRGYISVTTMSFTCDW